MRNGIKAKPSKKRKALSRGSLRQSRGRTNGHTSPFVLLSFVQEEEQREAARWPVTQLRVMKGGMRSSADPLVSESTCAQEGKKNNNTAASFKIHELT